MNLWNQITTLIDPINSISYVWSFINGIVALFVSQMSFLRRRSFISSVCVLKRNCFQKKGNIIRIKGNLSSNCVTLNYCYFTSTLRFWVCVSRLAQTYTHEITLDSIFFASFKKFLPNFIIIIAFSFFRKQCMHRQTKNNGYIYICFTFDVYVSGGGVEN